MGESFGQLSSCLGIQTFVKQQQQQPAEAAPATTATAAATTKGAGTTLGFCDRTKFNTLERGWLAQQTHGCDPPSGSTPQNQPHMGGSHPWCPRAHNCLPEQLLSNSLQFCLHCKGRAVHTACGTPCVPAQVNGCCVPVQVSGCCITVQVNRCCIPVQVKG